MRDRVKSWRGRVRTAKHSQDNCNQNTPSVDFGNETQGVFSYHTAFRQSGCLSPELLWAKFGFGPMLLHGFAPERRKWGAVRLTFNQQSFRSLWWNPVSPLLHALVRADNNPAFIATDLRRCRGQESYAPGAQLVRNDSISVTLSRL